MGPLGDFLDFGERSDPDLVLMCFVGCDLDEM